MQKFVDQALKQVGRGTRANPAFVNGAQVYPQTNNWSCGPMSLRHCLIWFGIDVDHRKIADVACATRAGAGDINLQTAAHRLGLEWHQNTLLTARAAKSVIDNNLKKGRALILCVDGWDHWISVFHHSHRGYLIFDSSRPGPVVQLHGWEWLKKQLRYVPKETGQAIYSVASITKRSVQNARTSV